MKEGDIVRVKVLGLGAALAAGFVPDQGYLKHSKTGASISQNTFAGKAGTVQKAIQTGAGMYPVTIEGVIYHEGLVSAETGSAKYTTNGGAKRELVRFNDNTLAVDLLNGQFEVIPTEALSEAHAQPEGKHAK